ncbi:MAG TPA: hypothetical protein VNJ02_20270 [Vicinamibacterales bacterium]|nr:hypothetical protein [Vicinamibacterales bacterium]
MNLQTRSSTRRLFWLTPFIAASLLLADRHVSLTPVLHAQTPATAGQWAPTFTWPVEAVHTHLLPTGKVMFYGFDDDSRLWDPATGIFTPTARAGFNIFCTGHSYLPDGRLFLAGGTSATASGSRTPPSTIRSPIPGRTNRT